MNLNYRRLRYAGTLVLLGLLVGLSPVRAGTHPDFLPRPDLVPANFASGNDAKNAGYFEITNTTGAALHKVKRGDYMLVRYFRPPDGHPDRFTRPGSTSFTRAPDMSGTGFDSFTFGNGVVQVDNQNLFNNILFSSDFNASPPDRVGPPDGTTNCNCVGVDWERWGDGGPGTLYQFTLEVENIPDHLANRWLIMNYGTNQEWPVSFQKFTPLRITDIEIENGTPIVEAGTIFEVTVNLTSLRNSFNGIGTNYSNVRLREAGRSSNLRRITNEGEDYIGDVIPLLEADEETLIVVQYEALVDGPAWVDFQLEGDNSNGDSIYSPGFTTQAFIGGQGDLSVYDLQATATQKVFFEDTYQPRDPFTRYNRGTLNRGAEQVIYVENKGDDTTSFRLKVTETDATNWDHDYLLEGVDIGAAITSTDGYLIADLEPGEKREFFVSLRPDSTALTPGTTSKALFELYLEGNIEDPMDAINFQTVYVPGTLDASMEIVPVSGTAEHFELRITVTNNTADEATSVLPRIVYPLGASLSQGTLPYKFISGGYFNPSFVNIDAGASHTFIATMELLLPGVHELLADAGGRVTAGSPNFTQFVRSNFVRANSDGSPAGIGEPGDWNFDLAGDMVTMVWEAEVGKTYVIKGSTTLADDSWGTLGDPVTPTTTTASHTVPMGTDRFFQVFEQ